jgi:hypothetical protein
VRHLLSVLVFLTLSAVPALAGHDIGATRIDSPNYECYGRGPFGVVISVYNYGTEVERDFPVWCWIDSCGIRVYEGSGDAWANLWPGQEHSIQGFPLWYPAPGYCTYSVTAFTALPGDENPANDTVRGTCALILARYQPVLMSNLLPSGPTLDGFIDRNEPYIPESEMSDTAGRAGTVRPHGSCLICMNHVGETAYIAVDAIAARTREDRDRVIVKFDENHDGVWAQDSSEGTYTAFISGGIDSIVYSWLPSQQCPGCTSATGIESGNLQFEIAIPIGTRRGDLNINAGGDLSGAAVSFWRGESCYGWWPQSLELAQWDDPNYFGVFHWVSMAVAEGQSTARSRPRVAVVRGVLFLPPALLSPPSSLFALDGREVMDLKPGANDVSRLSPGVYFCRQTEGSASSVEAQTHAVTKVIIAR